MNVVVKRIEAQQASLVPLSDLHVGHIDFDEQFLKNTVAQMVNEGTYTILLGDIIDGIGKKDRRYENDSIAPYFLKHLDNLHEEQIEYAFELLKPLKEANLIICTLPGNHEVSIRKQFDYNAAKVLAKRLGVPLLTDPGYVVLVLNQDNSKHSAKIWCSHGYFMGGRLTGSKVNALERISQHFCADVYLAGHTHLWWVVESCKVELSKNFKLDEGKRFHFANTGAFLRTYREKDTDSWASRNVFSPQVPGVVRFDFRIMRKAGRRYLDIHGGTQSNG